MTGQFPDDPLGAALFGELLEDPDQDDDGRAEVEGDEEREADDDPSTLH